jgi:hypothetical protein
MGEEEEGMKINVVEYFTPFLSGFVAKLVFSTVPNLKAQATQTAVLSFARTLLTENNLSQEKVSNSSLAGYIYI